MHIYALSLSKRLNLPVFTFVADFCLQKSKYFFKGINKTIFSLLISPVATGGWIRTLEQRRIS